MPLIATNTLAGTPASVALTNADFEAGTFTGWTTAQTGDVPAPTISTVQKHTGTYSAFLGAVAFLDGPGLASISQNVAIPAGGEASLSFWYWPSTGDTIEYDQQRCQIRTSSGATVLANVLNVCENDQTWKQVTFDLTPWVGQTIQLYFWVNLDSNTQTTMYVDDVTVTHTPGVTLAAASPGPAPILRTNVPTDITGAMRSNSGGNWTSLEAQRAAASATLFYQWVGEPPRYSTGTLVVEGSVSAPAVGALITVSGTGQTIAPTSLVHHITSSPGDTVSTITPPTAGFRGTVILIADAATDFVTGGNIASAVTIAINTMRAFYYDGTSWFPM